MKIRKLAESTGLSIETIRKYRERGLLRPSCNPENGYYEYSNADVLNLLYIRKLRGAHLSLDAIEKTYTSDDTHVLLESYQEAIESLEDQLRILKRREMMLRLTVRHYERDVFPGNEIRLIDSFGVKYDSYFERNPDPVQMHWVRNIDLFTLVLCIEKQYFLMDILPEKIPIRLGIGTYQEVIQEEALPLPASVSVFPQGRYASFFLTVTDLESIDGKALFPVRDYLRKNNLMAAGDTTAYLYRVDNRDSQMRFIFCVRFPVEPASDKLDIF